MKEVTDSLQLPKEHSHTYAKHSKIDGNQKKKKGLKSAKERTQYFQSNSNKKNKWKTKDKEIFSMG